MDNTRNKNFIIIAILTLVSSMLPEIMFREIIGFVPDGLYQVRLIILIVAGIFSFLFKQDKITKYIIVLGTIVSTEILTRMIFFSDIWQSTFDTSFFVGSIGSNILLKVIGIIPVVCVLLVLYKSPRSVYLVKGNLTTQAGEIKWLGIKKDTISWGRLALISAVLISFGTLLLVIFTVTGSSANLNFNKLIRYFPIAIFFAVINSLCEGIVFRSAILGSLRDVLPKHYAIFMAALIFGIGHYYGAPSGVVGVVMSGFLGWYMSLSMYETEGFATSWVIHFMQDAVIFITIILLSNLY